MYCKTNRPITFKSLLTRNLKLVYMPKCSSRHVTGKYPDSLQFSDVHRVISRDFFFPLCVTGGIALRLTLSSSQGCKAFYSLLTGRAECIQQRNKSLLQVGLKLVSQARSTSAKKGSGELYMCIKAMSHLPYSVVQSCYSTLSHDTLHHCLSSNNGLENSNRELGHFFHYDRTCKHTWTILLGGGRTLQLLFLECIILNLVMSSS